MLTGIGYGTYIIFGLLTYLGAAFVWFIVPETKRLSLEEMDTVFGIEGVADRDFERMKAVNREVGLEKALGGDGTPPTEKGEHGDIAHEVSEKGEV